MIGGPLFSLRMRGMLCPCCENSENKCARHSLKEFNRLGLSVSWHAACRRNSTISPAGFMKSMFGRSNNNTSANSSGSENSDQSPTPAQLKVTDSTKESINYGEPFPELQICPRKNSLDENGPSPGHIKQNAAMSFQLDIPLHHILRIESIDTTMLVIYTKDVTTVDKKAGTDKEAARVSFQSSDARDAASLDLKVLVEWNKHRQPDVEEDLPAVGIRQRAQNAAHFAKRELEMREKKRDREKRKAGHMQNMNSGGMKYTAMAMANQGIS
mmetsp:Transcript_8017/g.9157  ORF Transcript_8017/g.9157 Transcript_8017/m.9157 type:complete len:270 (+) Transcript_8017:46-855(+)